MKEHISKFLQSRIDAGDFPSAVYLVAEKGEIVFTDALGYAVVEPERIEARLETIYDLASLTKVLVTGLLAAKFVEGSHLDLSQTIEHYLPELIEFEPYPLAIEQDALDVYISELVSHHSAYPAWRPFYLLQIKEGDSLNYGILWNIANRTRCEFEPEVIYSDLNFLMLAGAIEKIAGKPIDLLTVEEICLPLNLTRTSFNPDRELRLHIAASEKGNEYERQLCIEQGYLRLPSTTSGSDSKSAFRDYQIWGEVHDNNAYFMRGVAGHAGLFSTAEEVFKIALQFLPSYTKLLKPETCELFTTNFTPGMNEERSFAFQLASTKDSTAGTAMSPQSFGHTGFTGTSLWIDPITERIFVLLTNRTHDHALPFENINSVRRRFHDLAIDLLDQNS